MRATLGDGTFGGGYERPDEEMLRLWEIAVGEVRERIESGW
jgi:creatinine amidohydrolase